MNRDAELSRRAVEGMIAEGHIIVIFEESILKLDSWLDRHPGGRLAVLHMVGRDATDEIKIYHSPATLKTMGAYRIARKPAGTWISMKPPIRGGVYRKTVPDITSDADDSSDVDNNDELRSDTDEDTSDLSSLRSASVSGSTSVASDCDSVSSLDDNSDAPSVIRRRLPQADGLLTKRQTVNAPADEIMMTAAEYTEFAMQQDIDRCVQEYPSVDPLVQEDIVHKYRLLHQKIIDDGLYNCPYLAYGKEAIRYTTLFTACILALRYEWFITSAVLLGVFWQQIMFSAHDAGHQAITHIFAVDTVIALFIADFCCGLSMGWWKSSHNVHHLITNHPEHDPDIQNTPLFATCPSFFKSIKSTYYNNFVFVWDAAADFLVPYQKYTYYPVMGLARFNLYMLSWLHVLSNKSTGLGGSKAWWIRPTEIGFMSCYWFLFGYCLLWRSIPTWTLRVAYVLVSHIVTMPLHVQITLSHWGMPTADLGESESFPQRQLRTTMDVDCPAWLDFYHGGLQFQAVHHLFPRLPRHNLRKAQVLVREFCSETGIPYSILTFSDGNRKVVSRLQEVADQAKILVSCQKYMARTGESGLA